MERSKKINYILPILVFITTIISIISPISILVQEYLVNTIENIINKSLPISSISAPIILLSLLYILPNINLISDYLKIKWNAAIDVENILKLQCKLKEIPYILFENNELYDKIQYLKENNIFEIRLSLILQILGFTINGVLYIYVLLRYSWILPILFLVFLPCTTYFITKFSKEYYNKLFSLTFDQRMSSDKMNILTSKEYAKELRIFGCSDFIQNDWQTRIKGFNKEYLKSLRKYSFVSKLIFISQYIPILLCLYTVLFLYQRSQITLAAFVAVSNHLLHMNLLNLYQGLVSNYNKYKLVCKTYKELNTYIQKKESKNVIDIKSSDSINITFNQVSFRYPNSNSYALKDVSFQLKGTQKIALVGENGSGKSTLIKLLLGLYQPEQGEILINGISINQLSQETLSEIFGCTFQDYARYALSLKENIIFGREEKNLEELLSIYEIDKIASHLNYSYDTILGKLYGDSAELSGGEWQKIGIARTFAGEKRVLIFDEPTAALDPIAEVNIFQKIIKYSKKHITFFVTHRLGITNQVDKILVIDHGKVCEIGSFQELMKRKGKFYNLYEAQRQLYFREESF